MTLYIHSKNATLPAELCSNFHEMNHVNLQNSNLQTAQNQVAFSKDESSSIELSSFASGQDTNFEDQFDIDSLIQNSNSLTTLSTSNQVSCNSMDLNLNCPSSENSHSRSINGSAPLYLPPNLNPNPCNDVSGLEYLSAQSSTNSFINSYHDFNNVMGENLISAGSNDFLQEANPKSVGDISTCGEMLFENREYNFQNLNVPSNPNNFLHTRFPSYDRLENTGISSTISNDENKTFLRQFSSNFQSNHPDPKFSDNGSFLSFQNQPSMGCNWHQLQTADACIVGNNDTDNGHYSNSSSSRTDSNDTDVGDVLDIGSDELPPTQTSCAIPSGENRNSSKKTAYNEKWGVKVFKAWCSQQDIKDEFERLSAEGLNDLLTKFWKSIRKSNGDYYGRNSLFNLRAMINKHLKGEPYYAAFDIVTDDRFRLSNECLDEQLKRLKSLGRTIAHKVPISPTDIKKLYETKVFSTSSPISLLRKVWFEITLHFCPKGGESQEKIKKSTFKIFFDETGRRYVARSIATKQEGKNEARMYDTYGAFCPVKSFELYISKLHPMQPRLFQQPRKKTSESSTTWYGKSPIGEKALQQMMANISIEANLSKRYTNHCVRTTALQQFTELRKHYEALEDESAVQPVLTSGSGCMTNGSHVTTSHPRHQVGQNYTFTHPNTEFSTDVNRDTSSSAAINFFQQSSFDKHFVNDSTSLYNQIGSDRINHQPESFSPQLNLMTFLDKTENVASKKSYFFEPPSFPPPPAYNEHQFNKLNSVSAKRTRMGEAPDFFYQPQSEANFPDSNQLSTHIFHNNPTSLQFVPPNPPPPYSPFSLDQNSSGKDEQHHPVLSPIHLCLPKKEKKNRNRKKALKTSNQSKPFVNGSKREYVDSNDDPSKTLPKTVPST